MRLVLCRRFMLGVLILGLIFNSGCSLTSTPSSTSSSSTLSTDDTLKPLTDARKKELLALARQFIDLIEDDAYSVVVSTYFAPIMSQSMDAAKLEQTWHSLAKYGTFERYDDHKVQISQSQGYDIVVLPLILSKATLDMQLTLSAQGQIAGLYFRESIATLPLVDHDYDLPANIVAREMTFEAQKGYPLNGTLTLPKQREGRIPAVVLVHGSGPMDRDETVYANHPFRDLALGLTVQGIAVLRYDKITHTHAQKLGNDVSLMQTFTVDQETVLDAIGAVRWLKEQPEIDPERVFVLGHSQGGMLAPYIDARGADVAGLIIMAGTPRKLWELSYDQNLALLEAKQSEGVDVTAQLQMVNAERQRAEGLAEMTLEEAATTNFFGSLQGYYLKHWEDINAIELMTHSEKPALILQGERDFQVYADKDFALWQENLGDRLQTEFKLYPGLSHLFGSYEGEGAGTTKEYAYAQPVDPQVIDDIVTWVHGIK